MKKVKKKSTEKCHFTALKNRCILHGRFFVIASIRAVDSAHSLCARSNGMLSYSHYCFEDKNLVILIALIPGDC